MKAKHIMIAAANEFEPIKVEITIESLNELKGLWHRTNATLRQLQAQADSDVSFPDTDDMTCLWEVLDNILISLGARE